MQCITGWAFVRSTDLQGNAEIAGLDNGRLDIDGLDNGRLDIDGLENDGRMCE